ncbi:MAG: hypothetical protein JXR88_04130 [Clostridia bacterium]|nr:hypothetical protein [Clostridia bacterium]
MGFRNKYKWNYLIAKAGLSLNCPITSKEEALNDLMQLSKKLGRTPTLSEFQKEKNYPSVSIFYNKFEAGYKEALRLVGLKPNKIAKYTESELEYYMLKFYKKHKCTPTRVMFNMEGTHPYSSIYEKHYGSWTKAVQKILKPPFCLKKYKNCFVC